ncbi:hypothetical protein FA09DRAFT_206399 [Tilletiopsis washingtonensis]|uniref:UV radiation resistance protein/autophagy-related protein 14 n=1 Tax=Tilletiopsis washingtonensis TaxID=58919 RepID=A0A316ZEE2_9BASI|nr:hypothetical protein FA09DRAFT_206399 [Tilletiopsis washingtonensis]PWO00111.1 hypothetical protein FA09DRAFT_206399 [Tilletiopsis washingtonensis]
MQDASAEREGAKSARAILARRREVLARRKARLETARRGNLSLRATIEAMSTSIASLSHALQSAALHARRATLLGELEHIYPIDLLDASSLLFSINNLALPNTDNPQHPSSSASPSTAAAAAVDEETRASALGLVAQVVVLLSVYTNTPLHYPLATAGSRAVVQDGISCMTGPRAFPLYAKGVESYRFEYAVFLLNKNIEQLMNQHRVPVLDIRHTLGNLKNFIITVSSSGADEATGRGDSARRNAPRRNGNEGTTVRELKSGKKEEAARQLPAADEATKASTLKTHATTPSTATATTSWTASLLGWRSSPAPPAAAAAEATASTATAAAVTATTAAPAGGTSAEPPATK